MTGTPSLCWSAWSAKSWRIPEPTSSPPSRTASLSAPRSCRTSSRQCGAVLPLTSGSTPTMISRRRHRRPGSPPLRKAPRAVAHHAWPPSPRALAAPFSPALPALAAAAPSRLAPVGAPPFRPVSLPLAPARPSAVSMTGPTWSTVNPSATRGHAVRAVSRTYRPTATFPRPTCARNSCPPSTATPPSSPRCRRGSPNLPAPLLLLPLSFEPISGISSPSVAFRAHQWHFEPISGTCEPISGISSPSVAFRAHERHVEPISGISSPSAAFQAQLRHPCAHQWPASRPTAPTPAHAHAVVCPVCCFLVTS
jgi:hypothetical protein